MREIAATSDFDFIAVEPRRAGNAASKRGKAKKKPAKALLSRLRALWRYSTPFFAVAALTGLLAAVAVNAMYLQHGRHPAPLFGSTFKIEPPKPPPRPAGIDSLLAEKLPSRTAGRASAPEAALAPPPAVVPQQEAPNAPSAEPAPAPVRKSHDAIGALIAGDGIVPPAVPAKTLLAAQRALQKLGAPVKPDGAYGASTRRAVEAFQRENQLPVTGELTAKTRHLLAARSGLSVE